MENKNDNWQIDLAMNICLILCFVLNFALTISIIFGVVITAMLAVNIFTRNDFDFRTKGFNLEDITNGIAQKLVLLIVTFLFTTVVFYNSLSRI